MTGVTERKGEGKGEKAERREVGGGGRVKAERDSM